MQRRSAFTLVEMMVVIALTLFIMVILTQAFTAGIDVFRELKSIGGLQEGLARASGLLRNDLSADHFEGKRRLSDANIWSLRPREGFVRVVQGSASQNELDSTKHAPNANGPTKPGCYYANNHMLHLAVKLRGNSRESVFTATVPTTSPLTSPLLNAQTTLLNQPVDARFQDDPLGMTFDSPWAEVAYYLVKTGTTVEPSNPNGPGTGLYALCRVQYIVVPDNTRVNTTNTVVFGTAGYDNVSVKTAAVNKNYYFNNPSDLVNPNYRRFSPAAPPGINQPGVTVVLTNVVSFTVRLLVSTSLGTTTRAPTVANGTTDFSDVPLNAGGFRDLDTGFDTTAAKLTTPGNFTIKALEISIRVWDQQTKFTQQVSIVQDM